MSNKILLSDLICTFYCAEDFQEWISELDDPDTEKVARERICEGLSALKISFNKHGDNGYFKGLVLNHINKSHRIRSYQESEEEFLLALFERWMSVEGQQLHTQISMRRKETTYTMEEYYWNFFIYLGDDIGRVGGFDEIHNLWFENEDVSNKAKQLLLSNGNDESTVQRFIACMNTVDDILENGRVKGKYFNTKEPSRKYILYLAMVEMISNDRCFGRENHRSVSDCFRLMSCSGDISTAGYGRLNLENCLDAYIVFSGYRYMMTCLPKRKQHRNR